MAHTCTHAHEHTCVVLRVCGCCMLATACGPDSSGSSGVASRDFWSVQKTTERTDCPDRRNVPNVFAHVPRFTILRSNKERALYDSNFLIEPTVHKRGREGTYGPSLSPLPRIPTYPQRQQRAFDRWLGWVHVMLGSPSEGGCSNSKSQITDRRLSSLNILY